MDFFDSMDVNDEIADSFEPSFGDGFVANAQLFGPSMLHDNPSGNDFPDDWSPLPSHTGDAVESVAASLHGDVSSGAQAGDSAVPSSHSGEPVATQPVIPAAVHDAIFARNLLTNCDVTGVTFALGNWYFP